MSDIWQFSSYSEPLVQKFLQIAATLDNNNEWSQRFGSANKHIAERLKVQRINIFDSESDEEPAEENEVAVCEPEVKHLETNTFDEHFCNTIEMEPSSRLDYMIEECLKRPILVTDLAEHLSMGAIEKLFNAIFTKQNINQEFISLYLKTFFPIFLKREQTWLTLDLLLKSSKIYPEAFEPVLISLIKDVNVKSSILQELAESMGAEFQKHLMFLITHVNVNSEMFIHHLHTLCLVYKDCAKTEYLQNFIQSKLVENASHCSSNKNYGRLFLLFLQAQKGTGFLTNLEMLDSSLSQHNSPFKRPCLNILKEMMENQT